MPVVRKSQIPPPGSDEDFEDLCLEIAKELWQDPDAYKVGTQGQNQHGVDVCSANALGQNLIYGIQAKKKKELTKQKLTKKNINETLDKAKNFEPRLHNIVIATTSSRDANLQAFIAEKKRERGEKSLFPFKVWFWDDIEEILRQECHSTYLNYLTSILPESAIDHLSKDIIKEALVVAEEFARNNYTEKAEGVLTAFKGAINRSIDPEIQLLTKKIQIQILLKNEQNDEAIELITQLNKEYPEDLDVWWLMYERAVEDEDMSEAKNIIDKIKGIDNTSHQYKIIDLIHKFHTDEDIQISEDEPPGKNNCEKAITFLVYHLYANKKGNKELRLKYLRKHEGLLPSSPRPIFYKIIYTIIDFRSDSENLTLEAIDNVLQTIVELENELINKTPLMLSDEIVIALEKIQLHVMKSSHYVPSHQLPAELRSSVIKKICKAYYNAHNEQRLFKLLTLLVLNKEEIDSVINHLKNAKRKISRQIAYLLIAQAFMRDKTMEFAKQICKELSLKEQGDFIKSIEKQDIQAAIHQINGLDDLLLLIVIKAIPNKNILPSLINDILPNIKEDNVRAGLLEIQIFLTLDKGGDDAIKKLKRDINIKEQGYGMSLKISQVANTYGLCDIEVEALEHVLELSLSDEERALIEAQLIAALFKMEDYPGVVEHKDYVLNHFDKLSEHNQKVVFQAIIVSLLKISQGKVALIEFSKFFHLFSNEFEFAHLKAQAEIDEGKYSAALATILEGLRAQSTVTREMFFYCHNSLIEISNAENIKYVEENVVKYNTYVKLSDIGTWFYIGDRKPIDASMINSTDDKYKAIIGKELGQEIEWPPDKYSQPTKRRTIESILTEPNYVGRRATESLIQASEEGSVNVHSLTIGEEGNFENLKRFWEEREKDKKELFKIYEKNKLPFAFLIHIEGSIGKAMATLRETQEGFIYINDSTQECIDKQLDLASKIIDGGPAFIDATSLFFLIETGLIEQICENIGTLYYTPSVVNHIRDLASHFAPTPYQAGRLAFGKANEPIFVPYYYQEEAIIKREILNALEHFEKNENKATEKFLSSKESELEIKFPSYIIDPLVAARIQKYPIITEDYFCSHSIKFTTKEEQAQPMSSLALIEILHRNNVLGREEYLNFIDYLLRNRCHLVPISANIIFKSIFGDRKSGLYIFQPHNIKKLHLGLTLSEQYGVQPITAIRIMSEFIDMIINDNSIDLPTYKTLLFQFLTEISKGRDYSFGKPLLLVCEQKFKGQSLSAKSRLREQKLEILRSQIEIHFSGLILIP